MWRKSVKRAGRSPCRLLAIAAAALTALSGNPAGAGQRPEVEVRASVPSEGWNSASGRPVTVEVNSRRSGELNLMLSGDQWRVVRSVMVDAGVPLRFETPMFGDGRFTLSWSLGEQQGRERFSGLYDSGNDSRDMLTCVNAVLLRELEALPERKGESRRFIRSLPRSELPSDWQSYFGLRPTLVLDADDLAALSPRQAEAMSLWIQWMGGSLWVIGENGENALAQMGLSVSPTSVAGSGGVRRASVATGAVFFQSKADASELWNLGKRRTGDPLHHYYGTNYSRRYEMGGDELRELGEVPVEFTVIALILLGILLGPVNFWYAKRRKNLLLLYLVTPVCALLGSAAIVGGSFLMEGIGGEYNQNAILFKRGAGNDALLFDQRYVRPGLVLPSLRFSPETLVIPFPDEPPSGGELVVDLTDGVVPGAGWFRPRFPSGYLTARPLVSRMNVDIVSRGGGYAVVNNLGHRLHQVAVRLPDGSYGLTGGIEAGGEAALTVKRGGNDHKRAYDKLRNSLNSFTGGNVPFDSIQLIAEAEGLPYIENGGLGGSLVSGKYHYVVLGDEGAAAESGGVIDEP